MSISQGLAPGQRLRFTGLVDAGLANRIVKIKERKADDSGWWLHGNQGGLCDAVIDNGTWQLVAESHAVGDGPCDDCGGPNIVWFTDNVLWNRVIRDGGPDLILCVHCFVARAEAIYDICAWRLIAEGRLAER